MGNKLNISGYVLGVIYIKNKKVETICPIASLPINHHLNNGYYQLQFLYFSLLYKNRNKKKTNIKTLN